MIVVHRTPGLIDLQAFTIMGLSAKPSSAHPIGMFGTGMKYAIATLVRLGANPVVWIGLDEYVFSTKKGKFRDREYSKIRMRVKKAGWLKPRYSELPFTTDYGKFWEPWMAFREMHSNTLDEGGTTFSPDYGEGTYGTAGCTTIVVDHPLYYAALQGMDETFHPLAARVKKGEERVQFIAGSSERLYYRGLRVANLPKKSVLTYNILEQSQLTEDRTMASLYSARALIARAVAQCDDERVIRAVVTADEDHWEHRLEFPSWYEPSAAFRKVVAERPAGLSREAWSHGRARESTIQKLKPFDKHPRPWTYSPVEGLVLDLHGTAVLGRPSSFVDETAWEALIDEVLRKVNPQPKPVVVSASEVLGDDHIPF